MYSHGVSNARTITESLVTDRALIVRYVPSWMPGTGWQRTAKAWRSELTDLIEKPCDFVKGQIAQGIDNRSFMAKLLDSAETPMEKYLSKRSAASLYTAGEDTVRLTPSQVLTHTAMYDTR